LVLAQFRVKVNGGLIISKALRVTLLVTLVLGLVMTSCSSTPSATLTLTEGTQLGNLAPDFQFNSLEGESISLSDLRGKPVLINFWATRCPPCVSEIPYLQEIYNEWSGTELILLVINIGESPTKVKEFLQGHNLSLPVLLDAKQLVANKYRITAIPTTFFIDKDGIIQEKMIGAFRSKADIEKKLSKITD